ncbi:flagellar basal-body MS-ring/collar protein FliF [Meridianimarinicoccus aquatilis]|uniref:Flagellar M-ring protein n=1 Tax=Meridianimarinicoccus aquatilis TaxID=2552766 RepID=A0A4V3BBJ1_9RHOB|nr:flagellar basal-body MS-ring/collar protein FliF [Fluviibacterium aquatile]TDL87029.1 flagellar M-ring protein FliF [Fluviibacterium aquatile]
MQNVAAIWSALSMRKKLVVIVATLGVFASVLALSRMAATPTLALLYSGLDAKQSGEVLQELEQQGVTYAIRGDGIFVPSGIRDSLRMQLAANGVPLTGGAGYELLDGLSGFGTTSQMFDAAYWRAKEGELARTILSSPEVRQVRVHIANPMGGPFQRGAETTASVMITSKSGLISNSSAQAFSFLVASAVQGMRPENVAIIDSLSGRIIGQNNAAGSLQNGSVTQEATLKRSVERLLTARLGPGNSVVEIAIDPVTETETIRERRLDPQSRVAISTDVEELTFSDQNSGGGGSVTVASNLPGGDAAQPGEGSQTQNSETRTVTNFEISEITRDVERQAGAIKRLTVAVLLNSSAFANFDDTERTPSLEQELSDIQDLVSASVGFDEARGDQISVKAMMFEPLVALGTSAQENSWLSVMNTNSMQLIQLLVLAIVTVAISVFVVRPILVGSRAAQFKQEALESFPIENAEDQQLADRLDSTQFIAHQGTIQNVSSARTKNGVLSQESLDITGVDADGDAMKLKTEKIDTISQLKSLVEMRQPDTVEILRNWLEDDTFEERA